MNIQELKLKTSEQLITQAEELGIENASTLRKQEILFAILKKVAEKEEITGAGVLQLLQDGFGFLRAMESNYLPGPDYIYVSPSQIRKFGLRTGDTVEGPVRAPKEGERYFALLQVSKINFEEPEKSRHKIAFENLTPLYPDQQLVMEVETTKVEKKPVVVEKAKIEKNIEPTVDETTDSEEFAMSGDKLADIPEVEDEDEKDALIEDTSDMGDDDDDIAGVVINTDTSEESV